MSFKIFNSILANEIVNEHLAHVKKTIKNFGYTEGDVVRKLNVTDPNAKITEH